ncbi:DUF3800 domain-containing protein [Variovorax sp. J22R133]|uniref:DUF3800 domain-containing protein n=1 Tax=Variovorax brevis TaxID=3053503 RepID=UPI0025753AC9|nr:DUF3800 domain-containing protein [Variovorax sp. J22R133]MDM0115714.1 DUF3800 domain-containing protein [Variovorax sp. J22R133]
MKTPSRELLKALIKQFLVLHNGSMQLLFIDESGTPPQPKDADQLGYFVLGGVVVPEEVWVKLAADLNRIKAAYQVHGEIKWRYFAPAKGGKANPLAHLSADEKEALRCALYKALTAYKTITIISVVAHAPTCYQKDHINRPEDIYQFAYKQLTERFQYFLQDLSRRSDQSVHGIVVCDHRGPKDDDSLRNLHATLMSSPTANISEYHNVIEGLFIAPSHLSVGIQFADIVAGAIFRKFKAGDDRFYRQVAGSLRTSPTGSVLGYGVVKLPRDGW